MRRDDLPMAPYRLADPGDFVRAVLATLGYWLTIHTDAEVWASEQMEIYGSGEKLVRNNPVLSFCGCDYDLADAIVERWCEENTNLFVKCSVCGAIGEAGYDDPCECQSEYDEWKEEHDRIIERRQERLASGDIEDEDEDDEWEDDEPEEPTFDDVDAREVREYFSGIYEGRDGWDGEWVASLATDWLIERILENEGFKAYRDTVRSMTHVDSVIDEVRDAIQQILDAVEKGRNEVLLAATWASHIRHVSGDIMEDYANSVGADPRHLDTIQQGGPAGYFGQDTIDAWLKGDLDPDFESEIDSMGSYYTLADEVSS